MPFNRPALVGDELRYMQQAIALGKISGDGEFSRRCHALLERELGAAKVLLTTSCTHALEMTALLLDIVPGDEVILPSFTFVSTVNAFVLRGARPVFADIRADTLNLDETRLEHLIGPRTRAVVPVHYAGVGCDMEAIGDIASRHGLAIVEDNAHGLFGRWRGRLLGSFGGLSTLSFHETKNFTCGEGGALVVNDPRYVERAEIVREKGTNRSLFFRGQIDRYTWVDVGSSYLPSDLLAAFLLAQLEARDKIQAARQRLWERYNTELAGWAATTDTRLPHIPAGAEHPYHMFYLLLPSLAARQSLIAHLKHRGILAVFHYVPLHLSELGKRIGRGGEDCPVTVDVSDRLLRLPLFYDLSDTDQSRVIAALHEWQAP
ncbi:MAG: dTDP-4-amino-4,6-dideoxygalactose transaminase [Acidobacteriota bacterium]|nr:dTDP-4-amino-4,6-dideoxygalactose transaminase [Acidobacteriota bacterium]